MKSFFECFCIFNFILIPLNVTANVAPLIAPVSSNRLFDEGTDNSILCGLEKGSQPVNFEWLKNGYPLSKSTTNIHVTDSMIGSLLHFKNIGTENEGNYTCVVRNNFGSDKISIMINVKVAPKWLIEPKDIVVVKGSDLNLECDAIASPKAVIFWRRVNTHFENDKKVFNVKSVNESFNGEYECVVSTKDGEVLKKKINVTVCVPAKFEEKHKTMHAKRGENAKLPCDAIGDKPLTVSWTKDDKSLARRGNENFEIIDHVTDRGMVSELVIESVQRSDNAEYKCTAENEFGSDNRKIILVVIEVPSPPTNLKVKESWSRSASISWSAPFDGHSSIIRYKIQYWSVKTSARKLHEITTTSIQTTVLIDDLKPGQTYEVT
ncbi:hemicentin-1-like protein, partial [Leptotrombidium deliense]